jgi:hypothetical protein
MMATIILAAAIGADQLNGGVGNDQLSGDEWKRSFGAWRGQRQSSRRKRR